MSSSPDEELEPEEGLPDGAARQAGT
jgi:hypothetical protein